MARKSKMSVLKRQREVRKAEKAALKRERRERREGSTSRVATREDLEAYGSEPALDQGEDR
jgi:hypothetical protein